MMNWIVGSGKLRYSPEKPNAIKRNNPWWIVVDIDRSIQKYYGHWINNIISPPWLIKRKLIQTPLWGGHITVLDGRQEPPLENQQHWGKYHNLEINFEYSVEIEHHWKFWVLPVKCPMLNDIREELGLDGNYPFHITIGRDD